MARKKNDELDYAELRFHFQALVRLGSKEYVNNGGLESIDNAKVRELIEDVIRRSENRVRGDDG